MSHARSLKARSGAIKLRVVDDDVDEPTRIHFLDVEALGDEIAVAVQGLGGRACPVLVSLSSCS